MVLHGIHEFPVPDWSKGVRHQKPSPFFRASTPSIHRLLVTSLRIEVGQNLRQAPESLVSAHAFIDQKTSKSLASTSSEENHALVNSVENRDAPASEHLSSPQSPASSASSNSATNPS